MTIRVLVVAVVLTWGIGTLPSRYLVVELKDTVPLEKMLNPLRKELPSKKSVL